MAHQRSLLFSAALLLAVATAALGATIQSCRPEDGVDCFFQAWSAPAWRAAQENAGELQVIWREYLRSLPAYPAQRYSGRGIVIPAGPKDVVNVPVVLELLRSWLGCTLPIEIVYVGTEATPDLSLSSTYEGVYFTDLLEFVEDEALNPIDTHVGPRMFQVKPLSVIHSRFEEVLLLDADNLATRDPSFLFDDPGFRSSGALFWPDFWRTNAENPIWAILGLQPSEALQWEQESGQVLVNKRESWAQLHLAALFNSAPFARLVNGDKDTFRFAWLATEKPYSWVDTPVAAVGIQYGEDGSDFCGHSMAQAAPGFPASAPPLFIHHNSMKLGPISADSFAVLKRPTAGKVFMVVPMPGLEAPGGLVACIDVLGEEVEQQESPLVELNAKFMDAWNRVSSTLKHVSFRATAMERMETGMGGSGYALLDSLLGLGLRRSLVNSNETVGCLRSTFTVVCPPDLTLPLTSCVEKIPGTNLTRFNYTTTTPRSNYSRFVRLLIPLGDVPRERVRLSASPGVIPIGGGNTTLPAFVTIAGQDYVVLRFARTERPVTDPPNRVFILTIETDTVQVGSIRGTTSQSKTLPIGGAYVPSSV